MHSNIHFFHNSCSSDDGKCDNVTEVWECNVLWLSRNGTTVFCDVLTKPPADWLLWLCASVPGADDVLWTLCIDLLEGSITYVEKSLKKVKKKMKTLNIEPWIYL